MDIRKMDILDGTIQSKFNMKCYINFLSELLKGDIKFNRDLKFKPNVKGQFQPTVESFIELGTYKDPEGNILTLVVVKLKTNHTVERARAMQRNFIKDYFLKLEWGRKAALVAFFDEKAEDWRLSFVKIDAEIKNEKLIKNITPVKRYSFLVGKNEKNHTAKKQLWDIFVDDEKKPLVYDIEQIFSIEKVTNEFYESYKQKYFDLKDKIQGQQSFNELAERLEFTAEKYSKKLMGQLVFLYFLQKKGWLGVRANPVKVEPADVEDLIGTNQEQEIFNRVYKLKNGEFVRNGVEIKKLSDKEIEILNNIFKNTKYAAKWGQGEINFIRRIFNVAKDSGENFFKDYLEPLFYEALNDKRGGSIYYRALNCLIPFLNGGLFKTIESGYDWKKTEFILDNEVFSNENQCKNGDIGDGILDVFDRYAFTVNEAEPLETDVAVDPEMLGKVFENLLDIKDRKSKGAFYTPREIVHYMCQESLINYLQTESQISYEDIEQLIRYGDIIADEDKSNNAQKTCEFLMPQAISANSKNIDELLKNVKIADPAVGSGAFPLGMVNEILRARLNLVPYIFGIEYSLYGNKFNIPMDRRPYQIKLDTIQNCIHAVDIEPSAVDIAKLRLWLSLIVEEDSFKEIRPLPNLDYNIMCGNSLIDEFEGTKLFDERMLLKAMGEKQGETYEQISIFGESNASRIMDEIRKLQKEFFSCVDENQRLVIKNKIDDNELVFVKETLRENNQQDKIKEIEAMWKKNAKPYFLWKLYFADVFMEKGGFDIVIGNPPYGAKFDKIQKVFLSAKYPTVPDYESADFFIDKGRELLHNDAMLAYIVPNMFLANVFAEKYRRNLLDCWCFNRIDNLSAIDVFESAKVRNCIIFFTKRVTDFGLMMTKTTIKNNEIKVLQKRRIMKDELFNSVDNWLNIIELDEAQKNVLEKISANCILLGEICEISQGLIPYDKYRGHSEEIIKNRVWHANHQKDDTYRRELGGKDVDRYLVKWSEKSWISYGEWLAAPRKKEFFVNERILIREITNPRILAAYTLNEYYNTPSIINCINFKKFSIKYILGILNSKLMVFYHLNNSPKANKGLFPKILVNDVRKLPIAMPTDIDIQNLINLVDKMLNLKKKKNTDNLAIGELESAIDTIVYQIYGLNESDIDYVQNYLNQKGVK